MGHSDRRVRPAKRTQRGEPTNAPAGDAVAQILAQKDLGDRAGKFLVGVFHIQRAMQKERPVRVGLGTDLGAGTSFSILATLNEAYKAAQLNSYALSASHAYYVATRGRKLPIILGSVVQLLSFLGLVYILSSDQRLQSFFALYSASPMRLTCSLSVPQQMW